ncbi:MAG: hypothetical protein N2109_12930 [Fimbriimonadales bacterium]|nr:hypothetical protein [Fimbriimonadales bacterium]
MVAALALLCTMGLAPGGELPQSSAVEVKVTESGVSLFADNADAHEVFVRLAKATGLRIMVDDTVRRSVTLNLVGKEPTEVLEAIASAYGLACKLVGTVFMVSEGIPKGPSSYLLSDIDAVGTRYVLAPTAKSLLPIFLQDHVKTNQEQNSVILSAPPSVLKKFREDVSQFDIPAAQIMIEVLMVEFTDSATKEFALSLAASNAGVQGSVDSAFGEVFYRAITGLPDVFRSNLRALVEQGKARVRANPRIATVSGQDASIFIGKQRYISTPVVIGGDQWGGRQTNSIDAGVRLRITPWTGGTGDILLDIRPEISVLGAPDPRTGLPDKSTRQANTSVIVRDGETVILGGLTQDETMRTQTKIPLLGDLPLVGQLFRSVDERKLKTEMVVFITPRILPPSSSGGSEEKR